MQTASHDGTLFVSRIGRVVPIAARDKAVLLQGDHREGRLWAFIGHHLTASDGAQPGTRRGTGSTFWLIITQQVGNAQPTQRSAVQRAPTEQVMNKNIFRDV